MNPLQAQTDRVRADPRPSVWALIPRPCSEPIDRRDRDGSEPYGTEGKKGTTGGYRCCCCTVAVTVALPLMLNSIPIRLITIWRE